MSDLAENRLALRQQMRIRSNSLLRLVAKDSPHHDLDWDFLCECGSPNCNAEVPLVLFLYDDLRDSDEFVLAPGHSLQRADQARAWLRDNP